MGCTVKLFGKSPCGRDIYEYTLDNGIISLCLISYGAAVKNIFYKNKDVVLGYDDAQSYIDDCNTYMGAIVGRYCGRIANGSFEIYGNEFKTHINSGRNTLHGGESTLAWKVWDAEIVSGEKVIFRCYSPDGEGGFPGNLQTMVTYQLNGSTISIDYSAYTDKTTVINLTNHTYFNLNGFDGSDIGNHLLKSPSKYILELDEYLIPTVNIMPVKETPFDFSSSAPLSAAMNADHSQIALCAGIDHCYIVSLDHRMREAFSCVSSQTGICMTISTDQPGIQLYTGNFLDRKNGKEGLPIGRRQGFCLEPQHFPNSPNNQNFPSTILKKGDIFKSRTEYKFSCL